MGYATFASVDREALRWLRTSPSSPTFDLLAADEPVASLSWEKERGSVAVASIADGQWSIERLGFLNPHVAVRRAGEPKDIARLSGHRNHHRIELADGTAYDLRRAGLLVPAWHVLARDGTEILHIESVRDGRRLDGGTVQVSTKGVDLPVLPILLLLSWFFIVESWREDEVVSEWADHVESRF